MSIKTDYETIKAEQEGSFLIVTINREKKLNALNEQVLSELKDLLTEINAFPLHDLPFSGMIVTGAGEKAFIAGADIAQMREMTPEQAQAFGKLGQDVTLLFEALSIPVIACVQGYALGGGCEMAMSCDFIYATKQAIFGQPEVKLGLIPGFGGTQRLAKLIGRNRAKELIYTGKNLKAEKAYDWGLVNALFDDQETMMAHALKTLTIIKGQSPLAISKSKLVMNEGNDLTIENGLNSELKQFAAIFGSEDMREGTQAFLEKRAPEFQGR